MLNKGNYFIKTFDVAICTTHVWLCRGGKQKQVTNRSADYLFLVGFISVLFIRQAFQVWQCCLQCLHRELQSWSAFLQSNCRMQPCLSIRGLKG